MKVYFVVFIALLASGFLAAGQDQALPQQAVRMEIAGPVLMVTDLERSLRFYTEGLGLEVGSRLSGKPGPGATITAGKGSPSPFVLLRQQSADTTEEALELGNGLSRIMLVVQDPVATAARLKAAGFKPDEPSASGIFFVEDPDGYRYEIIPRRSR